MPPTSRAETEDLMEALRVYRKYGHLNGVIGRALRLVVEYLDATEPDWRKR